MKREKPDRDKQINRVVSAVGSLARAVVHYETESEHTSMSGTYDEERELREALEDLFETKP